MVFIVRSITTSSSLWFLVSCWEPRAEPDPFSSHFRRERVCYSQIRNQGSRQMDRGSGQGYNICVSRKSREVQTARQSNRIGNECWHFFDGQDIPKLAPKTQQALDWGSTLVSMSYLLLELTCHLLLGLAWILLGTHQD